MEVEDGFFGVDGEVEEEGLLGRGGGGGGVLGLQGGGLGGVFD
jgi:hypothetical protein